MISRRVMVAVCALAVVAGLCLVPPGSAAQALTGKICYAAKDGETLQLHVMDADGKNDRTIPNQPCKVNIMPAWSPDGKQIAFTSGEMAQEQSFATYIINVDGTGLRRLGDNEKIVALPAWSTDGKTLLCTVDRGDKPSLVAFDAQGGGSKDMPTGFPFSAFGFYSPDGKQLAFSAGEKAENDMMVALYIAGPDGSNAQKVTQGTGFCIGSLSAWSPDGKSIAYVDAKPNEKTGSLHLLNVANKADSQLTDLKIGGNFFMTVPYPSWSPDGKWIAYCEMEEGQNAGVWRISSDGKTKERITPDSVSAHSPAWSR